MSDENTTNPAGSNDNENANTNPEAELVALKARADMMGIKYSPNIGLDALKKRVNDTLTGESEVKEDNLSEAERKSAVRQKMIKEELKLIRVRITNMNPAKKDLAGEIFCVSNKYLGDVKKFIPFGEATDEGYHVPNILLKQLKARKFQQIKTKKKRNEADIEVKTKLVNEFAIEVLDPLTEDELAELKASQMAAAGL